MSCSKTAPATSRPCNLILVGFMACGKTTVGKQLANSLGFGFIDLDEQIERSAGCSIADIFSNEGEEGFRRRETRILNCCQKVNKQVISTGGGIIGQPENRALLPQLGFVVWLRAQPEAILQRAARNSNRPLLQVADPAAQIESLMSQREPLYQEVADLSLRTDSLHMDETVSGIIDCASLFFAKNCK